MEQRGAIKHLFPGANTSEGFYSYNNYIFTPNDSARIFILKGGPDIGKTKFMKKIGEELLEKGFNVEYMHSSSDDNYLDGIVIPKLMTAIIDSTASHIVELKNSSYIDEVINLGEYSNDYMISEYEEQIKETKTEIERTFKRAYRYLKAAKLIYDDIRAIYTQSMDFGNSNVLSESLIKKIFCGLNVSKTVGKSRHLFASAITPEGLKNYIDTIIKNTEHIYIIKGEPGTGKSTLLTKIINYATSRGMNVEAYHCAFDPDKIEHILIPQLSTVVVTSNEYHNVYNKSSNEEIIDLNQFATKNELIKYETQLNYDRNIYNELLNQAVLTISSAKRLHDLLESYYIPSINTIEIDQKKNEIIEKILKK